MKFKYSKHALEQIQRRQLNKQSVDEVLYQPEAQITDNSGLKIYQKTIQENDKYYLYRVFVSHTKNPPLVVTVYKTSKIEKYEN